MKHKVEVKVRLRKLNDRPTIKSIQQFMKMVNRLANDLSRVARKNRAYSKQVLWSLHREDFKKKHKISDSLFQIIVEKVVREYTVERKTKHPKLKFRQLQPPLRFNLLSPIWLPQSKLSFRERCDLHLPTLGRNVRVPVEFGRFRPKRVQRYIPGWAHLRYHQKNGFDMTIEVELPDHVALDLDSVGVDRGLLTLLTPHPDFLKAVEARRKKLLDKLKAPARTFGDPTVAVTQDGKPVDAVIEKTVVEY